MGYDPDRNDYPADDESEQMEPVEFIRQLDELVGQAEERGLHPFHVMNAMEVKLNNLSEDSWESRAERSSNE